jgi:twitching motility two-component system response regulator PilG
MMKGEEFLLGIIGLNRVERMTVASVCSLTQSRPRGYTVLPEERCQDAHITLVDADDAQARQRWQASPSHARGRPALLISRNVPALGETPYTLSRANFAAKLIKILDQITIREFNFVPELVVSDSSAKFDDTITMLAKQETRMREPARVLVVDDSLAVRTSMKALLELNGLVADLAADAHEALALLMAQRYSLIFLDVVMPGMDGYTACRQIRAADKNAPPVVMLTGRDSAFDKIRGVMAGCSRYLTKPIAVDALNKVLTEFLPKSNNPLPQSFELANQPE